MNQAITRKSDVPKRALLLSLLSLWVPIGSSALFPDWTGDDVGVLVWLLALVPGFLLSYYRGWRGASLALAGGMAAFSLAQVVIVSTDTPLPAPEVLLGVVLVLTTVSLASGWLSTRFHRSLDEAERMALTDSGTGIPNRRHAILELEKGFAAARRGSTLAVVLFDLDHFKRVNDEHGHAEGDRILTEFAALLEAETRSMHVAARFGGEEFLAILRESTAEGARIYADRVRERLREVTVGSEPVTVSAGVAAYEEGMASPDVLVAAADQALYRAKRQGRDRVVVLGKKGSRIPDDAAPAREDDGARDGEVPAGRGELVLVVDDDVDALPGVSRALRRFGYAVLESRSPARAVEVVRGLDDPVDVVLTDIVMPEMGGFRLVEILGDVQDDVRAIYMSGYSQEDVDWGGVPGTAYDYLEKPISIYTLARRVRRILDRPMPRHDVPPMEDRQRKAAASPSVLVLDPDERRSRLLVRLLAERGYPDARCGRLHRPATRLAGDEKIELVVADANLPRSDLRSLLEFVREHPAEAPPVLLAVEERHREIRSFVVDLASVDFVTRPFDGIDLRAGIERLLREDAQRRRLREVEEEVDSRVVARTAELEEAREEVLRRLAWAAEFRDDLTGYHAERVGILSGLMAEALGWPAARRKVLEKAAPLHDLGKISIPDSILKKAGPLTSAEKDVMDTHTTVGAKLLAGSRNPVLQEAERIARTHHEWWDGTGYPAGLAGEEIPASGRIVAVADVFDSLSNDRPYRDSATREETVAYLRSGRESQFDPRMVDAFTHVLETGRIEQALDLEIVARPDFDRAGGR